MTSPDLAPQAAEVARVVTGVRDDQLTDPTPCAGTSVAALLDHLVGLTIAFREAAEKIPQTGGPRADAANLAPDWRIRIPMQLDGLVAAWQHPTAWQGDTHIAGMEMPAAAAGTAGLNEVLIHGWDIAVATGQEYRPDPDTVRTCFDFGVAFAKGAPEARDQMYGPVVPVPEDAPLFDRLLGQAGRDPSWAPPSS
ncbi:MAG TPA: TIGR03086 family metal-binding protein [Blastococcus sp.]